MSEDLGTDSDDRSEERLETRTIVLLWLAAAVAFCALWLLKGDLLFDLSPNGERNTTFVSATVRIIEDAGSLIPYALLAVAVWMTVQHARHQQGVVTSARAMAVTLAQSAERSRWLRPRTWWLATVGLYALTILLVLIWQRWITGIVEFCGGFALVAAVATTVLKRRTSVAAMAAESSTTPPSTKPANRRQKAGQVAVVAAVGGVSLVRGAFILFGVAVLIFCGVEYHHAHTPEFKLRCAAHINAGYPLSFPDNALCAIFY